MPRWYIGWRKSDCRPEAFSAPRRPTEAEYGDRYHYVTGPFRTERAARWAERCGYGNPHCRCVEDAERLSRRYAEELSP